MKRALLALALVSVTRPAHAVDPDPVRTVLAEDRFRFCHEKDYPLTTEEKAWCPIVGETSEVCPALPAACKLPPVDEADPLPSSAFRGRAGMRRQGRAEGPVVKRPSPEDTRKRPDPEPETKVILPDLSGLANVVLLLLSVIFAVVIGRALAKHFLRGDSSEPEAEGPPPDQPPEAEVAPRGPVETDVDRLLARARAAAGRGEYARAIDDAYAALLRRLDGDGLIEIHPSRTNGDYVRRLSDRDLRRAVRAVARDVERVQFGDAPPSEPMYRAVLERVLPLVGKALSAIVFCLGLSAIVSCGDTKPKPNFNADTSPSGTRAVIDVLAKHGIKARYRSEPLSAVEGDNTTLVILAGAHVDEATWKHLTTWIEKHSGHLVIAGALPPAAFGARITPGREKGTEVRVSQSRASTYGTLRLALPAGPELAPTRGEDLDDDALLERGRSVYATVHRRGQGTVHVFADDNLFSNVALTAADNAEMIARLFIGAGTVDLVDEWTGRGAATPMESVDRAHLTPVILQLLALLGVLYLWRGRAFARLRDPAGESRRAFADHARALGAAYARARASRHVLGVYSVWALDRLRERVHLAGRSGLLPLAEAIAARTGRTEPEVMRVLVEATSARDEAAPASSYRPRGEPAPHRSARAEADADLALMRELEGYLTATGHRRSPSEKA